MIDIEHAQELTITMTAHGYKCDACGGLKFCVVYVANQESKPDDCPVIGITTTAEWKEIDSNGEADQ